MMHAFDVLGDPVRRHVLELLSSGEHTAGEVSQIVQARFGVTQAAVSQHLKVLRESGFASVRPEGTRRIYALQAKPLREIDEWLDRFRHFWEPKLSALETEVARGKFHRQKADGK